MPIPERSYMATRNAQSGRYAVSEVYLGCGEAHKVGDCRDFAEFEEADDVARRMAAGEFPEIRPRGRYVNNR